MSTWIDEIKKAEFWSMAERSEYCWEWRGSKDYHGYGRFRLGPKSYLAHRISYCIIFGGDINNMDCIAHKCDNTACINPHHLFQTDHQGNMTDKQMKGRARQRTSKYSGVGYRNDSGKWRAYISIRGERTNLGCFSDERDAALAHDRAMIKAYGIENCINALNLPEPPPTK